MKTLEEQSWAVVCFPRAAIQCITIDVLQVGSVEF